MQVQFNIPKPVPIEAGEYKALKMGFLFERRIAEGESVTISQEFLDSHKEKTGRDFTSSWLELVELAEKPKRQSKPKAKAEPAVENAE